MARKIIEPVISETHKQIFKMLRDKGIKDFCGGVQLFANQFDTHYSVSINYLSTGIYIPVKDIDVEDLVDDPNIRVCKTYECKL